jgi:predicted transcriptional regulator
MPKQLSESKVAKIHAYRAMNYSQRDIADVMGISKQTVTNYLKSTEAEAQRADHPLEVFGELMEHLLDVNVEVQC